MLLELGYTVEAAVDGQEAVQLFPQFNPDIVVLDMRMPKMSGPQTCAAIRETSDLPIIMFTSTNDANEVKDAILQGASDFVLKSTGVSELPDRIAFHLQKLEDNAHLTSSTNQKTVSATPAPERKQTTTTTLLIDPDEESRATIKAIVTRLNQNVVEVGTATEAIEAFKQHDPDIVITEWKFPDMDAAKMLAQMKQKDKSRKVLKLVVSKRLPPESMRKATYAGITDFLNKPFDLAKVEIMVADRVRTALRGLKKRPRKAA